VYGVETIFTTSAFRSWGPGPNIFDNLQTIHVSANFYRAAESALAMGKLP